MIRYGRLCMGNNGMVHNGLHKMHSANGVKYPNKLWNDGFVLLPTNHLVVAFDSDQSTCKIANQFFWFQIIVSCFQFQNNSDFFLYETIINLQSLWLFNKDSKKIHLSLSVGLF